MGKIIILDDSSFQRKILKDMVESLGHSADDVATGQALLDKIAIEKYDCICLDLLMPEMSGIDVLEKLNELKCDVPVIVISADIQVRKKEQCFSLGAKAFINKYIDKKELETEINKLIN